MTDRTVDIPAKMAELKFPRGALFASFHRAVPYLPTAFALGMVLLLQSQKK
jgi:hypothetical protein